MTDYGPDENLDLNTSFLSKLSEIITFWINGTKVMLFNYTPPHLVALCSLELYPPFHQRLQGQVSVISEWTGRPDWMWRGLLIYSPQPKGTCVCVECVGVRVCANQCAWDIHYTQHC